MNILISIYKTFRCGSGTWLLELARMYPNNEYYGVDIAPLFPTDNVPENVRFLSANINNGLPFDPFTFDFVHQRLLVRNLNTKQWQTLIEEMTRITRPYGYIELVEMDLAPYSQGPITRKLFEACK
jgi:ubiquinone/menaquinone biosynthesis C-methylase UbiE